MILSVPTTHGEHRVQARRCGPFAIHRTVEIGERPGFTLTHIKSGRALRSDLCCKDSAIGLGRALNGFNWDFDVSREQGAKPALEIRVVMQGAKKIIGEWKCPNGCKL